MKRILLSFLTLCFALSITAEPVGKQAALYTAQNFMLAKGKQINAVQKPFKAPRKGAQTTSEEEAYYFVFNAGNNGGYVIVSGDDRTEPILGYVEEGSFDPENIPENMRSWLQGYADEIKYIVDNDIKQGDPRIKKRNKVIGTKHSVAELLKSRWNQGHPYNLTCPKYYKGDGTQHYPAAGCVATAMAQVMYFYKFPNKTKAIIPAHSNKYTLDNGTEKTVQVNAVPRNTLIDWENMRDTYSCNDQHVHDAQDTAVANLMLYCGQAVKMGWGASSGASTSRARDVYVNYFGYDARAYWGSRDSYTIDEWFDMLYNDICAGYPVLFAGHSSGGGHAFVLDGFDGDNLFHVNWGWGGSSNGWFLVGILNPGDTSGMGASSSSDGYSMSQGAVFNLRTPDTPKDDPQLSISDVTINSTRITAKFTNKTGSTGTFNVGIVMQNEDGTLSLVGTRQNISSMGDGVSATKSFAILNKLPQGTFKLSPASKSIKSNVWHPKYNMRGQYIEAVVDSLNNLDLHFINPDYEDIRIDTIIFPGTRIVGQEQEVKVRFRNEGKEYFKTVYLFASKTDTKVYTESKSKVAVRSGESIDVSYFFKPEETGTYNLWLCTDDKGNNVMGQGTIDIITEAEATKANLSVSSYQISNATNGIVYGKRLIGTATIRNNGLLEYNGSVKFQIWSQKVGDSKAYSGSSRSYNVVIPRGKSSTVEFEFDNLNEGYYYRFKVTYGSQEGTLGSGGIWDHKWEMKAGLLTWKTDGTIAGKAYSSTITTASNICGVYANCSKINRMVPNRTNPNAIYAFASGMEIPASLDTTNVVSGNHANYIDLVNDKPFFIPSSFDADSASYTYTFDDTEDGTMWHAFTMPFEVDSIFIDDEEVSLEDSTNHFWIYEFAAQSEKGEVIFAPATELRSNTPYIIAGDTKMAGRSIVFRSHDVPFYKTGSDKMLVTSPDYKFHGNTFAPKLKDCYILNAEGTAFEYITTTKILPAQAPYFTTNLPEELRLDSIVLPEIPVVEERYLAITDETDTLAIEEVMEGYTVDFTHNFNGMWEAIYLPFSLNYEAIQNDFDLAEIDCILQSDENNDGVADFIVLSVMGFKGEQTEPNMPYLIRAKQVGEQTITLENTCLYPTAINTIDCSSTKTNYEFIGWYNTQDEASELGEYYVVKGGSLVNGESELAPCRWYMKATARMGEINLPSQIRIINADEVITGISSITEKAERTHIYNLAGQRLDKMQKGINIVNGRKVLR